MTKLSKLFTLFLVVLLANIFNVNSVLALIPPLPSSFYGTVKVNGENVADGTVVKALINGQAYATGYTQTYEGNSVYSVDIPGDDSSTTAIEGGKDGNTVQFMIGEAQAVEIGIWKSATNVNINLTASVAMPLNTPQATPTPVPTQTAIKPTKKVPTATTYVQLPPTEPVTFPTLTSEPAPVNTQSGSQVLPQPTQPGGQLSDNPTEPVQQPTRLVSLEVGSSGNNIYLIVLIIILAVVVVWALLAFRNMNRSKER